jgi:hypothetical protein
VISQARARQDVRNIAAWVVSVLRTLPTEEIVPVTDGPSALPILLHQDISGYDRMRWMEIFRSTAPADRQTVLDRFRTKHPYDQEPRNPYAESLLDPWQDAAQPHVEQIDEDSDGPSAVPILLHKDISSHDRRHWLDAFRGAAPADRQAVLDRFRAKHPYDDVEPRNLFTALIGAAQELRQDVVQPRAEKTPVTKKVSSQAIMAHKGISTNERSHWLQLYCSAAPADRQAVIDRFHEQYPEEGSDVHTA